jgi:hypothetical protein
MIREDIRQQFPELFGTKRVNGREVNVEQTRMVKKMERAEKGIRLSQSLCLPKTPRVTF